MLTCVCRPVSGNLPKMPPSMRPITKQQQQQQQRSLLNNNNNNILNNNNNNNIINNNNNNIYNNNNHMVVVTAEPKLKVSFLLFHLLFLITLFTLILCSTLSLNSNKYESWKSKSPLFTLFMLFYFMLLFFFCFYCCCFCLRFFFFLLLPL